MKKRFFAALLCLCLLAGLAPNMGTTAYAAGLAIGTTVEFAGHEWYIIGTDNEADGGVTAPAGCYTLLAKDNEFGTSKGVYGNYKDSELFQKINELVSNEFVNEQDNIMPRTLTAGDGDILDTDPVTDQYLWPLTESEQN